MAIHALARYTNVRARIGVWADTLTITGTPQLVHDGAPRSRTDKATGWTRLTIEPLPETGGWTGPSALYSRGQVLVIFDVFWPDGSEGRSGYNAHDIDQAADDYADVLRNLSLSFLDYSSDPSSPSTVTGFRLRNIGSVTPQRVPTSNNYAQRRVSATLTWWVRDDA